MLLLADVAVGSPHLCTFRIEIKVSNFILFSIALLVRRRADDQFPACCAFAEACASAKAMATRGQRSKAGRQQLQCRRKLLQWNNK